MDTIKEIKESPVYKQILSDSYGGIMYNVDNHDKYNTEPIDILWDSMSKSEQESAGGIMQGVFDFLRSDE